MAGQHFDVCPYCAQRSAHHYVSHTAAKTLIKTLFLKCCRCHRPSSVISLYGGRAGGEWTGIRDEEEQRNKDSAREENARIMPEVS